MLKRDTKEIERDRNDRNSPKHFDLDSVSCVSDSVIDRRKYAEYLPNTIFNEYEGEDIDRTVEHLDIRNRRYIKSAHGTLKTEKSLPKWPLKFPMPLETLRVEESKRINGINNRRDRPVLYNSNSDHLTSGGTATHCQSSTKERINEDVGRDKLTTHTLLNIKPAKVHKEWGHTYDEQLKDIAMDEAFRNTFHNGFDATDPDKLSMTKIVNFLSGIKPRDQEREYASRRLDIWQKDNLKGIAPTPVEMSLRVARRNRHPDRVTSNLPVGNGNLSSTSSTSSLTLPQCRGAQLTSKIKHNSMRGNIKLPLDACIRKYAASYESKKRNQSNKEASFIQFTGKDNAQCDCPKTHVCHCKNGPAVHVLRTTLRSHPDLNRSATFHSFPTYPASDPGRNSLHRETSNMKRADTFPSGLSNIDIDRKSKTNPGNKTDESHQKRLVVTLPSIEKNIDNSETSNIKLSLRNDAYPSKSYLSDIECPSQREMTGNSKEKLSPEERLKKNERNKTIALRNVCTRYSKSKSEPCLVTSYKKEVSWYDQSLMEKH
ncbi:unnamed protein product [Owenia fusiformis]|uniref:Uncharacterized protein n=1 Tax=Owenia fusiformis TaxID=6347 RepID=A0A8J1TVB8_OWEFU|nr:unnamed protein product [Owenia fusiformis]